MDELLEWIREHINDKPMFKQGNLQYLRATIRTLPQEDIIDMIKKMNYDELKYVMGAGIQGHANTIAIELLRDRKKERDDYLARQPHKIVTETDFERDNMLNTAPSVVEEATKQEEKEEEPHSQVVLTAKKDGKWEDLSENDEPV